MYRNYHLCLICNQCFYLVCIDIRIVLTAISKDYSCTLTHKCQSRRYESIRWYNYFISRLHIAENGCHLQSISARSSHNSFLKAIFLLKEMVTLLCKNSVSRQFSCIYCLIHIMGFFARQKGFIKWYHINL